MKHLNLHVSGRVQDVNFRANTKAWVSTVDTETGEMQNFEGFEVRR